LQQCCCAADDSGLLPLAASPCVCRRVALALMRTLDSNNGQIKH